MDNTLQNATHPNPVTLTDEPVDFNAELGITSSDMIPKPKLAETSPGAPSAEQPTMRATEVTAQQEINYAQQIQMRNEKDLARTRAELGKIASETPSNDEARELQKYAPILQTYDWLRRTAASSDKGTILTGIGGAALALGPKILEMKYGIHIEEEALKAVADYGPGALLGADYGRKLKPASKMAERAGVTEPTRLQHAAIEAANVVSGMVVGAGATEVAKGMARGVHLPPEVAPFGDDAGLIAVKAATKANTIKTGVDRIRSVVRKVIRRFF